MVSAIVLEVVDGDTLKVELADGQSSTVRLIGIDTPESVKPGTPVECQAQEATENLIALVEGEAVTLSTDPTQDRQDRFGRLLAYVDRAGRDVGEAQIRAGFSRVYIYENRPFQRLSAYRAAENEAAAAERGAWKVCDGNCHIADGNDFAVQQGSRAESAERFVLAYRPARAGVTVTFAVAGCLYAATATGPPAAFASGKSARGRPRLSKSECAPVPPRRPRRPPPPPPRPEGGGCHPSYSPCVPNDRDYDCGELNGPFTVRGPDEYRLDGDKDGVGCE